MLLRLIGRARPVRWPLLASLLAALLAGGPAAGAARAPVADAPVGRLTPASTCAAAERQLEAMDRSTPSPSSPRQGSPARLGSRWEPRQPAPPGPPRPDRLLEALVRDELGDQLEHYSVVVKELDGGTGDGAERRPGLLRR